MKKKLITLFIVANTFFANKNTYAQNAANQQTAAQKLADRTNSLNVKTFETFLNTITTLESDILQMNPDGSFSEGKFYLKRPRLLRLEYREPNPILFIADGDFLIYHDKKLNETTHLSYSDTPAGFFLKDRISFSGDLKVKQIKDEGQIVRIELLNMQDGGRSSLTLVFTKRPISLRQWEIVDEQKRKTVVTLQNANYSRPIDQKTFQFVKRKRR